MKERWRGDRKIDSNKTIMDEDRWEEGVRGGKRDDRRQQRQNAEYNTIGLSVKQFKCPISLKLFWNYWKKV